MITAKHKIKYDNLKAINNQLEGELKTVREFILELQREKRELWNRLMASDFQEYKSFHNEPEDNELIDLDYTPDSDINNAGEILDEDSK